MSLADLFLADLEDIEGTLPSFSKEEPRLKQENEAMDQERAPRPVQIPSLLHEPHFQQYIDRIRTCEAPSHSLSRSDESFLLISESNTMAPLIEAEIISTSKHIEAIYRKRFPELSQIVIDPFEYIRVVDRLGNDWNIGDSAIFSDILPNNVAVAVTVTASTSTSVRLSESDMISIRARTDVGMKLHAFKVEILSFLKIRMQFFAPNLVAIIGPTLAAQLVSAAGGLENLATMPSQNIESVGAHRKIGANSVETRMSLVSQCDLVATCPEDTKRRAIRLVLGKAAIAARVDQFGSDTSGATGEKLREFITNSLEKANEPPPARAIKPLPIPADLTAPRTKRGGKRHRRMKEKYGMTEIQKQANRIQFGSSGSVDSGFIDERSTGMAGLEAGGGRIRKKAKESKTKNNSSMSLSGHSGIQISVQTDMGKPSHNSNGLFSSQLGFNRVPSRQ